MKIKEIIKQTDSWSDTKAHAQVSRIFDKYYGSECVVAYMKETMGSIIIIRGKQKYFAFAHMNPELYFGGYGYHLNKLGVRKAIEMMGEKINIVDEDLFGKLKKYMILEGLKGKSSYDY